MTPRPCSGAFLRSRLPQAQQGFQWGDAGLGAAGMLVLLGAGSGAVVAVRRRSGGALLG